jgi:hypothetical protein
MKKLIILLVISVSSLALAQTPHLNQNSFIIVDPSSGYSITLLPGTLTGNQTITFPNSTGTLSTGSGLTLPYSGSVSSAGPAFSISNTGAGVAISTTGSINLSGASNAYMIAGQTILQASNPYNNYSIGIGVDATADGVTNTAIGFSSMQTNIGSSDVGNTAVGVTSLASIGSGGGSDYNTAIGREAGFNIENGHTSGGRNTFLGADADVPVGAVNGITNATAVGFQAIVTASDMIQLGNPSVTLVQTSGDISTGGLKGAGAQSGGGAASNKYAEQYTVTTGNDGESTNTLTINNSKILGSTSVVVVSLANNCPAAPILYATPGVGTLTIKGTGLWTNGDIINYIIVNP